MAKKSKSSKLPIINEDILESQQSENSKSILMTNKDNDLSKNEEIVVGPSNNDDHIPVAVKKVEQSKLPLIPSFYEGLKYVQDN